MFSKKEQLIAIILIDRVNILYCSHRYPDNHLCTAVNADVAKKDTKEQNNGWRQNIQERITKYLKNSSNPTAKTVNMMRMKNKAIVCNGTNITTLI